MHSDAESSRRPWGEGEGSVVRLGDALNDCKAEADTCVGCGSAFGAALKRLRQCGYDLSA